MRGSGRVSRLRAVARRALTSGVLLSCTAVAGAQATPRANVRRPAVIQVPAAAPTIQQAIEQAQSGDTVLVAPGRYFENIRFMGKGIVVTSRFARTRNLDDVRSTIIDGSRPSHPDTGSVVRMVDNEDSTAVLQGFTITGGTGTVWRDAGNNLLYREGGGILCDFSAPVIRFNRIIGNRATQRGPGISAVGGGGIRCGFSEPTIEYNVIRENEGRYGAGVVLFRSTSVFRHNLVANNVGGEGFGGAGLWMNGYHTRHRASIVEQNTIVNNRSLLPDSGTGRRGPLSGTAGGLRIGTIANVRNNLVWGNSQAGGGAQLAIPEEVSAEQRWFFQFAGNVVQGLFDSKAAAVVGPNGAREFEPVFVDGVSYELTPRSPGRAVGSPAKPGGPRPDVGAYGGPDARRLPF